MSKITGPGRWHKNTWGHDQWFDAYYRDEVFWCGLNQFGKHDTQADNVNGWTYVGPLPDMAPATMSDEQVGKRFCQLIAEDRVRRRVSDYGLPFHRPGDWEKMPRGYDYMVLPLEPPTSRITIEATDNVLASIKAMEGVEVVE